MIMSLEADEREVSWNQEAANACNKSRSLSDNEYDREKHDYCES